MLEGDLVTRGPNSVHHLQVSLDLDPPGTQQALPELQRAAMPWNPTNTPSAPARQGPEQGNVQNQAGGQAYLGGLRHCLRAEAEAQRQGSLRPATAETSTEYFARMEACTAQPASTHGGTLMPSQEYLVGSALGDMFLVHMACS